MTTAIVVDASALAALLFNEPEAESVAARLTGRLFAPALMSFELANVCAMKCRRYPEQRAALIASFGLLSGLGVQIAAVDHDEVVELSLDTGLTAYDASYLWLARSLKVELVSLDKALLRAAGIPS